MKPLLLRFFAPLLIACAVDSLFACEEAEDLSRIAVAGGSLTEIVYLLGMQDNIVGTDTTSLYPSSAQDFPSIGYVRALSAEGVLSIRPTLLLGEDDIGPITVVKQLQKLGLAVRTVPEEKTAEGIVTKSNCVASILGIDAKSRTDLTKDLQAYISRIESMKPKLSGIRAAVIFGINDGVPTVAGTGTSGHALLEMIGINNVFRNVVGWKPISLESMVESNPEVLVIPQRAVDISGGTDVVVQNKSIQMTEAAKKNQIIVYDTMALLGFGPRTLQAGEDVAKQILSMFEDVSDSVAERK